MERGIEFVFERCAPDAFAAATGAGQNEHLIKDFFVKGLVSEGDNFEKDDDPIIIIPGVMGSRLFTSDTVFDDSTKVWNPVVSISGITQLNEKMAMDMLLADLLK